MRMSAASLVLAARTMFSSFLAVILPHCSRACGGTVWGGLGGLLVGGAGGWGAGWELWGEDGGGLAGGRGGVEEGVGGGGE